MGLGSGTSYYVDVSEFSTIAIVVRFFPIMYSRTGYKLLSTLIVYDCIKTFIQRYLFDGLNVK